MRNSKSYFIEVVKLSEEQLIALQERSYWDLKNDANFFIKDVASATCSDNAIIYKAIINFCGKIVTKDGTQAYICGCKKNIPCNDHLIEKSFQVETTPIFLNITPSAGKTVYDHWNGKENVKVKIPTCTNGNLLFFYLS